MPDAAKSLHLVLFFTRGVSLATWVSTGLLSREVVLYQRLIQRGVRVTFITHGRRGDLRLASQVPGIQVLCNRWGLPRAIYERLIPTLHRRALAGATLLKTQQIQGADLAVAAGRRFGKPVIVRCGWLWSRNTILEHGPASPQAQRAVSAEASAFQAAARVVLTTEEMRAEVAERHPGTGEKITVIPNHIDTGAFCPRPGIRRQPRRIGFIGRLSKEKNIEALIDAVRGVDVDLDIIGQGPLEAPLRERAASNPRVRFLGVMPNDALPTAIAPWSAFILPSFFEGHPKALLEAMACGVPVIATDVPGNRSVVSHGQTGLLCGTDSASLRAAIEGLLADPAAIERLGHAGRQHIVDHYALDRVVEMEMELLGQIAAGSLRSRA